MRRTSATTPLTPQIVKLIDVDHSLTGLVGEIFELSGWITDGDMNGPFRIEHTIEHSVFEGTTVMQSAVGDAIRAVNVRVNMHQPDRPPGAQRLQNRIRDGMIAAGGDGHDSRLL
jgi:hypothetical protein